MDVDEFILFFVSYVGDEFLDVDEDDGEGNGYNSWLMEER